MLSLLVIGGLLSIIAGAYLIFNPYIENSLSDNYIIRIIGIPFLLFGLYAIFSFFKHDKLVITSDRLIINSIFGTEKKSILRNTFKSYTEISKENMSRGVARMKWKDLTLYSNDFKYSITSNSYTNYNKFRNILIKGIKKNELLEEEWERLNSIKFGIGFVLVCPILIGLIFRNGFPKDELFVSFILFMMLFLPMLFGVHLIFKNRKP